MSLPRLADSVDEGGRLPRGKWLDDIVSRFCRAIGHDTSNYLNPQTHLIHGPPGKVVAETARRIGAEVVVMGTTGRSGIPGLLIGNTAEEILSQIDCAVVAVKPSGFRSPVAVASQGRRVSAYRARPRPGVPVPRDR